MPCTALQAAVLQLTRCMALDHAAAGVRSVAICPGYLRTAMLEHYYDNQADLGATRNGLTGKHPLHRHASQKRLLLWRPGWHQTRPASFRPPIRFRRRVDDWTHVRMEPGMTTTSVVPPRGQRSAGHPAPTIPSNVHDGFGRGSLAPLRIRRCSWRRGAECVRVGRDAEAACAGRRDGARMVAHALARHGIAGQVRVTDRRPSVRPASPGRPRDQLGVVQAVLRDDDLLPSDLG